MSGFRFLPTRPLRLYSTSGPPPPLKTLGITNKSAPNGNWKSNSNFYKDLANSRLFGPTIIKGKKLARNANDTNTTGVEGKDDNLVYWIKQIQKNDRKQKRSTTRIVPNTSNAATSAVIDSYYLGDSAHVPSQSTKATPSPAAPRPSPITAPVQPQSKAPLESLSINNPDRPIVSGKDFPTRDPIRISRNLVGTEFPRHPFPSVTKILKETMSPESKLALERWKQGKIAKLGVDGFQDYSDRMLARGHLLHERIAHYLLHDDLPNIEESGHSEDDEISDNHMKSITPVLEHFSKPLALESRVVHPELKYQGYTDCIALYKKKNLCLIDWKTSERRKPSLSSTFENPLQIAAYVGAFNHDPSYNVGVVHGCIVVVYNDGAPAQVLPMSEKKLKKYWNLWLERLNLYKKITS